MLCCAAQWLEQGDATASGRDCLRADNQRTALDTDAAISAHERWKAHLMDYLERRTTHGLDPTEVRRSDGGTLRRWQHGLGGELPGDQPPFAVLMARRDYFHEQAALLVRWAQQASGTKRCSTAATAMAPARCCCCSRSSDGVARATAASLIVVARAVRLQAQRARRPASDRHDGRLSGV